MKCLPFLTILFFTAFAADAQQGKTVEFYVAPEGKPTNSGTLTAPFGSPDQALAAAQRMSGSPVTIYLRGGAYPLSKGLAINSPLTITAYKSEKVIISGGKRLAATDLVAVTDQHILERLPANARSKVLQVDLKKKGITDYGKGLPHGYKKNHPADLELFFNGKPLTCSRWPNQGLAPIGQVTDPGSNPRQGEKDNRGATFTVDDNRAANWKEVGNAWVGGFFSYGYSDDYLKVAAVDAAAKTIKLRDPAEYTVFSSSDQSSSSLKNSQKQRGFYIYNLPEELDQPGEWFLDASTGLLYIWPPETPGTASDFEVSLLEEPLLTISRTTGVTVSGLTFEYSRGMGIQLDNTQNALISGCSFGNLGTVALSTRNQTTKLKVEACTVFNTGTGGFIIDGGDRKNLVAAENRVDNCELSNYSRIDKTYSPGINLNGVGNHITHCYIHDAPDMAIVFYGNDQDISYNHIQRVVQNVTDAGAVYTGRDLSSTGNAIKCNFFDNIIGKEGNSVCGLYLDDGSSGMEVDNNIFYNCGSQGTYHFGAVHINGGGDNYFRNNYFVSCEKAFSNTQWNDNQWKAFVTNPEYTRHLYADIGIQKDVYQKRYPFLKKMADSTTLTKRQNYSINTLTYQVGELSSGNSFVHQNVVNTTVDPGFANSGAKNFQLTSVPAALKQSADWKPVPFSEIGPRKP